MSEELELREPTMKTTLDDIHEDKIVRACSIFGADGFDTEDWDNLFDLAEELGLDISLAEEQEAERQAVFAELSTVLTALADRGDRLETQERYGVRLVWREWGEILAGKSAKEITAVLSGRAG